MSKVIELPIVAQLKEHLSAKKQLIHVVLGPRQVGKTTSVLQVAKMWPKEQVRYISADGAALKDSAWLEEQWLLLKSQAPEGLLIVDEIQKVERWQETVKDLWDRQALEKKKIQLILLGSSSLDIYRGLAESLAGRFFLYRVPHWNSIESKSAYKLDFEEFLHFGGYPGSYQFIKQKSDWLEYVNSAIVDVVIGKDILQVARVKSPALFRQCFELACSYGGQEISYTKLLGQLQERGNVELVKHYLELFESAHLMKQLFKFSGKKILSKSSSPKILPLCPALFSRTLEAEVNASDRGRLFEIAIGAELARLPANLFYWREGGLEVDYILQKAKRVIAIEVKSGRKKPSKGLQHFRKLHPASEALIITPENYLSVLKNLKENLHL